MNKIITKQMEDWEKEFNNKFKPDYSGGGSLRKISAYGRKLSTHKISYKESKDFICQTLALQKQDLKKKIEGWIKKSAKDNFHYYSGMHEEIINPYMENAHLKTLSDLQEFLKTL